MDLMISKGRVLASFLLTVKTLIRIDLVGVQTNLSFLNAKPKLLVCQIVAHTCI